MSISVSKWPMLPTIALCFIFAIVVDGDDVRLPVVRDEDVGVSTTSSSVVTW